MCPPPAHEACTRDISELKWHLKLKRDKLHQVKDRTIHTEVLNQRLNEDIDFVKKHGPLVREKLQLESDVMNQIKNAQHEVMFAIDVVHLFVWTHLLSSILGTYPIFHNYSMSSILGNTIFMPAYNHR